VKCPHCDSDFTLSWRLYFRRTPFRLRCPVCGTVVRFRHRAPYYLITVLYLAPAVLVAMYAAARYFGLAGVTVAGLVVGFGIGLPVDRYLDSRMAVLELLDEQVAGPSN
jgi:hypothetical protein